MMLAFTLSMPGCPSWNGKWSGEGKKYVIVHTFTRQKDILNAGEILRAAPYFYSWTDGWCAQINVQQVDSAQSRKLRKESNGFCGYDWMVNTIIQYGKPMADHEVTEFLKNKKEQVPNGFVSTNL